MLDEMLSHSLLNTARLREQSSISPKMSIKVELQSKNPLGVESASYDYGSQSRNSLPSIKIIVK